MKKVITVLGARPQFVKAAVLSRIIAAKNQFEEVIIHTGQHFDENMSDIFFNEMEIPKPKYNLDIHSLSHGEMTGNMMIEIERILTSENPDALVVYGDTNSTIAGALSAKKLGIKVIHIEAGLRSFNMEMPEEINRILTDRISDLLSCPTDIAISNLEKEGFSNFDVEIEKHGDIMKDALEYYEQKSSQKSSIIQDLNLEENEFVLATIHRQENTDNKEKLTSIFNGLERIHEEKDVVIPLHPRTKAKLKEFGIQSNIRMIDPVGYFDMLQLLMKCTMVVTDSGGLQKESYFNKKNVIIAREETEWKELVDFEFAKIAGSNSNSIFTSFEFFSNTSMDFSKNLYGNDVGEKIYQSIKKLIEA